jgi:FixJ family two-component response regulator
MYSRTLELHVGRPVIPKYDWRTSRFYLQIGRAHVLSMRAVRYCQLPTTPKPTVIVVDDDLSVCRALRLQLQVAGFNVLVFRSGESLLGSDFPTSNACLLLDVYMPGMSGIELCRSLAAAGRRLPTVLMSASDDELTRRIMSEARAVASLFKPFDEKILLRALRKALRSQSKLTPRQRPLAGGN